MNVPEDLKYTVEHEWIRLEGNRATIGITDYAQDQLGDVVFVDLPAVGQEVQAGGNLAVVESVKSVSDVYAPLSGRVVAVNELLKDAPETLNQDPYGEGWIAVLELTQPDEVQGLLDAAAYIQHLSGA
ncbi:MULTISPECIES: glycine cleavage system protein GcvH [Limnochorda]|uniref:glycine cleavage system protein GcvH n=1 Tax=Limnochorda TaxID=1676651 RepID=UPI001802D903|nr:glycine cleavage system protein GcvH [Limnochorda pilosa]MBO2486040.1 glycine cleavage system protein H [Bacillota bacterium]NMA72052.1 glycine cleavage system protein GcvH [Bacillota bacterium]